MKWYLAKLVYRIICGEGMHTPQFEEQLRLVCADDDLHAFQKARTTGHLEEDNFLNSTKKPVLWKFIDVSELHQLSDLIDGAELYSRICEEEEADVYIKITKQRATHILESSMQKSFPLN
ncbi:MAG: DUF4288 domain-containing protein [Bacteroidota bacterium]|nr:DUF4288 domain-containing protein [Bacteroidota bacterium]